MVSEIGVPRGKDGLVEQTQRTNEKNVPQNGNTASQSAVRDSGSAVNSRVQAKREINRDFVIREMGEAEASALSLASAIKEQSFIAFEAQANQSAVSVEELLR